MKYKEEGDIMRYSLDVVSNLASHPDEINKTNTENMLKDGVVDLCIKYLISFLIKIHFFLFL